jgi:hypothetical protein
LIANGETKARFVAHLLARWTGFVLAACGLTALLTTGCSPSDVGRVAGQVTLNGQPLAEGSILFQDDTGAISVNAALDGDGRYEVRTYDKRGLPPGTYRVAITPRTFGDGETPLIEGPPAPTAPTASPIPPRYRDVATSGLTATVQAGSNPPFNFDLAP